MNYYQETITAAPPCRSARILVRIPSPVRPAVYKADEGHGVLSEVDVDEDGDRDVAGTIDDAEDGDMIKSRGR